MKLSELFEDAKPTDVLFHITHTKNVPSIKKKGITLMNTTNWVQAGSKKRYGSGEIYCYDHELDALRGAARMDWDFNQEMGSGKISIVEFFRGPQQWEQDHNDPLTQFGRKGMWLKMDQPVSPSQIVKTYPFTSEIARQLTGRLNERIAPDASKGRKLVIKGKDGRKWRLFDWGVSYFGQPIDYFPNENYVPEDENAVEFLTKEYGPWPDGRAECRPRGFMKISEVTINEAWFSKKEEKTPKQLLANYADAVIARYAKKYGKQHGMVAFDNKHGDALRDVIAMGIAKAGIVPQFDEEQIKKAVYHFITDSYINFKLNGQVDDVVGKKVFQYAEGTSMNLDELKRLSGIPVKEGYSDVEILTQHLSEESPEWYEYASEGWSGDAMAMGVDGFNELMDARARKVSLSEAYGVNKANPYAGDPDYERRFEKIKNMGNTEAMKLIWGWIHSGNMPFAEFNKLVSDYWRHVPPPNNIPDSDDIPF